MTCMFCKMLNKKNSNRSGEFWCGLKKQFVPLISPKCEGFINLFESKGDT